MRRKHKGAGKNKEKRKKKEKRLMLILDNFLQEKSDQGEGITAKEEQLARWEDPYTVRREIEEKRRGQ